MTIKIITVLSESKQAEIKSYLDEHQNLLQQDVSKYAVGRQRYWFMCEPVLTSGGQRYKFANRLPRLEEFSQRCYQLALQKANLPLANCLFGLVAYGSVGIDKHRDDTYAAYPAVNINLSTNDTLWGYTEDYQQFGYGKRNQQAQEIVYEVPPGAVVLFNCKNPHRVVKCDNDRYSINLWSVGHKAQQHYQKFYDSQR